MSFTTHKPNIGQKSKKKPPPRPPPPNFSKYKSKSSANLNQQFENLIEWSPPSSPKPESTQNFGGSVSSSFSSSTSSLASSKKSFEYETPITNNLWPVNFNNYQVSHGKQNNRTPPVSSTFSSQNQAAFGGNSNTSNSTFYTQTSDNILNIPTLFGPTIIRAQMNTRPNGLREPRESRALRQDPTGGGVSSTNSLSALPMPSIPPPSPPREAENMEVPFGIALYDYPGTDPTDLSFQANDVIMLLKRVNNEWLYGRCLDREGMFPANFIDIQVHLPAENGNIATALYHFHPQLAGDLELRPGQLVKIIRKINDEWLFGESNGKTGQFPSNFIDRTPDL